MKIIRVKLLMLKSKDIREKRNLDKDMAMVSRLGLMELFLMDNGLMT